MEFFFLFVGLGFFLLCVRIVMSNEERSWQRSMTEMREFGNHKPKRKKKSSETPDTNK